MTTPPIQTLTDELLGEIERKASSKQMEGFALVHNLDCVAVMSLITELRTLRAQVKALQSDANSWQSGYDEGRRMAGKHRLSEIEQLRAENAELRKDAALWEPIIDEVHRRADKQWCLQDKCDFTVTVFYDDYAAISTAMEQVK